MASLHFTPTMAILGIELPPPVALLLTVGFVVFVSRRDFRAKPDVTSALWIPFAWMVIICSRSVTQWLQTFGLATLGSAEEGNPLDAVIYFSLVVGGICVLNKRQVTLSEISRNNGWIVVFLLYCFLAIFWSDFPLIAFKRWIKIIGHPVMALILFTEPDFKQALATLMKRSAYILLPFSILLIKYYPQIGRLFDNWGFGTNTGVTIAKNQLGTVCLVLGFFLFWKWLQLWRAERSAERRRELPVISLLLLMDGYLLWKAHSATSVLSLMIAIAVMLLIGRRWVNRNAIGRYLLLGVIAVAAAEFCFGFLEYVADLTGHEKTLIGRAELWRELLAFHTNPLFGVGFESFWLGDRLKALWEQHWWHPTEAHNGYLEIYLTLGSVGLFLLGGWFVGTFRKIRLDLLGNFEWGRFRLGWLVAVLLHNWTEASFKGLSPIWFVFYIISLHCPKVEYESGAEFSGASEGKDEEMATAYLQNGIEVESRH